MTDRDRHHAAVWAAIERIAEANGLTSSGLAKLAGFDATAFNPSKRVTADGNRWPSTETIAGVLDAVGMTWAEFGRLVGGPDTKTPARGRVCLTRPRGPRFE